MPIVRIVATDWVERQINDHARREGRSLSQMGLRLLTEALDSRRAAAASVDRLIQVLRSADDAESAT